MPHKLRPLVNQQTQEKWHEGNEAPWAHLHVTQVPILSIHTARQPQNRDDPQERVPMPSMRTAKQTLILGAP